MARMVPKKVRDQWVEALESGKYKQGHQQLKEDDGETGYCCLGVLCDISEKGRWNDNEYFIGTLSDRDWDEDADFSDTELPHELLNLLKIKESFGGSGYIMPEHRQKIVNRINKNHKDDPEWEDLEYDNEDNCGTLACLNDSGANFEDIAWVIKNFC